MKLDYPATGRNRSAILTRLQEFVRAGETVLEIASGSGQHAVFFAEHLPEIQWQPSSYEEAERTSISAYRAERPDLSNLRAPLAIDVHERPWPCAEVDVVFCANMIHIAPWSAAVALFEGAAACLNAGGRLITYGPYRFNGTYTSESNAAFNESLQRRNPSWGVRDLSDLKVIAEPLSLVLEVSCELPANNHLLVWAG